MLLKLLTLLKNGAGLMLASIWQTITKDMREALRECRCKAIEPMEEGDTYFDVEKVESVQV